MSLDKGKAVTVEYSDGRTAHLEAESENAARLFFLFFLSFVLVFFALFFVFFCVFFFFLETYMI